MVATLPPNVRVYKTTYEKIWTAVTEAVEGTQMLPLEFSDPTTGQFATNLIYEGNTFQQTRYRLSGTVRPGPDGIIVTLWNQQEAFESGRWHNVQTSFVLERSIFMVAEKEL